MAVPQQNRPFAGFLPRRPLLASRAVHAEFVVDKVALGLPVPRDMMHSSVSSRQRLLHIHSCIVWEEDIVAVSNRGFTGIQSGPVKTLKTNRK
jgi:hypothetical protein